MYFIHKLWMNQNKAAAIRALFLDFPGLQVNTN